MQQLGLGPLRHDLAATDEHHLVGDHLDLVQQVRGQQHGPATGGEGAEQAAHPVDAGGVQAVDRLVEDEHGRVTHERIGDAQALAHAQRVVAHAPLGLGAGETDQLQHLLDALHADAHALGGQSQHLAAGAAGVLGGGVQEHADVARRVRDVGEPMTTDQRLPRVLGSQPDHHPHARGLPGAVRAEEPGHLAGLCDE